MAGTYADYPNYRMAYDRDGTQVFGISPSSVVTQLSGANVAILNNENDDSVSITGSTNGVWSLMFMFPELRDVTAVFWSQNNVNYTPPSSFTVEGSTNTTNGVDGTWTLLHNLSLPNKVPAKTAYRTSIITLTTPASAVKAIRFKGTVSTGSTDMTPSAVHIFGTPSAGENPNRLILWHPTLNQRVGPAYFDWGDVRRSDAATDRTFRVKNNSSTLTANGVSVSFDAPTDASPTLLVGQHSLSTDGTTFGNTATIGALAAGAISGTVTIRRTIASNAALSLWTARVVAAATSWT